MSPEHSRFRLLSTTGAKLDSKPMAKRSAQISGGASPAEGASYETCPLDASTWDAFAELVERNNGVYGGCWCIAHHSEYQRGVSDPRALKEEPARAGRAHAALVFDEDDLAQGWCQYGSPEELGLKHQREYLKNPPPRARWRIACIFVDKGHRSRGVAGRLEGALAQIAAAGGGLVEAISEVTAGRLKAGSCSARPPSCSSGTGSREDGRSASTRGS